MIRTTAVASQVAKEAAYDGGAWLRAIWVTGVLLCVIRLVLSHLRVARIVRSSVRAPHLGADVLTSPLIAIPIAAGFRSPVIILPSDIAIDLDRLDLECIVAHERAHIFRNDIVGNLVHRIFAAVLFFNPWVYVIGRQLVKEREAACDDWAVRSASNSERYASCLANLAQRKSGAATPLLTPSAIGSGPILLERIARLLDGKASQLKTNYFVATSAAMLFAILGFVLQTPSGLASPGNAVAANNAKFPPNCWSDANVSNPLPPDIPAAVIKAHPHSQASVLVTVASDGRASAVKVVDSSGNDTIDKAASDAAAHSTYKPEMRNCKAVSDGKYLFHIELGP